MDLQVHPLNTFLQLHLGSDSSAALHLPYILGSLNATAFAPSSHLQKWIARVNSLLHSKDPAGRWAGLCLAHRTAVFSKSVMIDCGQSWISVALPLLSKKEALPVIKASIHLCRIIFSGAVGVPEFQRQVSSPSVPKFTAATLTLLQTDCDPELKILLLKTLTTLVPLYPNIHKTSYSNISSVVLRLLRSGLPSSSNESLFHSASELFSVLHVTGGKVGAAALWRKSVDETLEHGWDTHSFLRTTFPSDGQRNYKPSATEDPVVAIPLYIEQLRATVMTLCGLLNTDTQRPVQVPIGPIVQFVRSLLMSMPEGQVDGHIDSAIRGMEVLLVPTLWKLGCDLLIALVKCAKHHLAAHTVSIASCLAYRLEQDLSSTQRLSFMEALRDLLEDCLPLHSSLICNRLVKAILPSISVVLPSQTEVQTIQNKNAAGGSRKGRKRARGYEGDELFKASRGVIFPQLVEGELALCTCQVLSLLLRHPELSLAVHSIACRIVLSVLLYLPQLSPLSLSLDATLHPRLVSNIRTLCTEIGCGTTSTLSRSLGLVLAATTDETADTLLDVMLHPRVPPLVRSLPEVDAIALWRVEEGMEEMSIRNGLGIAVAASPTTEDVIMGESASSAKQSLASVIPNLHGNLGASGEKPVKKPSELPESMVVNPRLTEPVGPRSTLAEPPSIPDPPHPSSFMIHEDTNAFAPLNFVAPVPAPQTSDATSMSAAPTMSTHALQDEDEEMPAINMDSDSESE